MILGKINFLLFLLLFNFFNILFAEEKINSVPLVSLENLKPSFENEDLEKKNILINETINLEEKKIKEIKTKDTRINIVALDKITAKSSELVINLDEVKIFGPLEIKILKCEKVKVNNKIDDVAYMQVKDLTKNENEKVFIFNGWTFASDPSLTPFDHAIYDLQLLNC